MCVGEMARGAESVRGEMDERVGEKEKVCVCERGESVRRERGRERDSV